ncbi:hypothetical protein [Hankyongella ginsenosidimutans]|uniref:hypothetical protein n=1 Tax=Hankyongella ginsenosidimutans TaxID=1763828 RepID=UPI001FEC7B55|nr:hypothetical protein [Hankyongella ginsenosidimutans]
MKQQSLALAIVVALAAPALAQSPVTTRQIGTATLQNVPEIPAAVDAAVQRYQSYRSAQFQDWLADGSMLITTRFGDTSQLHRVAAPGAARAQLTWFPEPVADAVAVPGSSRFILSRDTGGDEWFQLELMEAGKPPIRLTEPGTRNLAPVFSQDGTLLLWSRATKGPATTRSWPPAPTTRPAGAKSSASPVPSARRTSVRTTGRPCWRAASPTARPSSTCSTSPAASRRGSRRNPSRRAMRTRSSSTTGARC